MVAPTETWNPGFRFKDGKLLIFEAQQVTLVVPWPAPEAARKTRGCGWQPFHPEFRLVRPYRRRPPKKVPDRQQLLLPMALPAGRPSRSELADQKRRAFDALRFALPREFAAAVERFHHGQFAMLRVFTETPEFVDLLVSNPLLAFVLADDLGRRRAAPEEHQIVFAKQAAIAEHVGFPGSKQAARLLRRVAPESITMARCEELRRALADREAVERLAHLRRINAGVLRLLGSDRLRAAAAPALLDEVALDAREKYRPITGDLLEDVLALEFELRGNARLPRFESTERVRRAHHDIASEYVEKKKSGILDCRFPPPPIPGTPAIVPLTEPRDLIVEGMRQKNCVASYAKKVERGDTYIYRVLDPERATLSIRREVGGSWYCSELLTTCNAPVQPRTTRSVRRWLEEHDVSA